VRFFRFQVLRSRKIRGLCFNFPDSLTRGSAPGPRYIFLMHATNEQRSTLGPLCPGPCPPSLPTYLQIPSAAYGKQSPVNGVANLRDYGHIRVSQWPISSLCLPISQLVKKLNRVSSVQSRCTVRVLNLKQKVSKLNLA